MKFVTRSDKTGLITLVSSFDFSSQTQRYMNKLLNFIFTTSYHSAVGFPGSFSKAQWQSIQAVRDINAVQPVGSCEWVYSL